jgi:hypothetical protein
MKFSKSCGTLYIVDISTKFLENPHGFKIFCLYTDDMNRPEGLGEKGLGKKQAQQ